MKKGESMKSKIILASLVVSASGHAGDLPDSIDECSALENDGARLECYDGLVDAKEAAVPDAPAAGAAPAAETGPATAPAAAPESPGAETSVKTDQADEEDGAFSTTVTRCSESVDKGRYIFLFSNGEAWKQTKNDRIVFRDCSFDVTITKDFFGHKMLRDGDERPIRIKRLK